MSEWFKVYVSKTYVGVFLPWVQIPPSSPKGEKMERKKFLTKNIIIFIIAVITIIVVSVIIKYHVEGEIDIPFQVSKVMVISNAYGIQKEETENKWDLELVQNNDIYIDILKNKNYTEKEIINKVILDNFEINKKPRKGTVNIYSSRKFARWSVL